MRSVLFRFGCILLTIGILPVFLFTGCGEKEPQAEASAPAVVSEAPLIDASEPTSELQHIEEEIVTEPDAILSSFGNGAAFMGDCVFLLSGPDLVQIGISEGTATELARICVASDSPPDCIGEDYPIAVFISGGHTVIITEESLYRDSAASTRTHLKTVDSSEGLEIVSDFAQEGCFEGFISDSDTVYLLSSGTGRCAGYMLNGEDYPLSPAEDASLCGNDSPDYTLLCSFSVSSGGPSAFFRTTGYCPHLALRSGKLYLSGSYAYPSARFSENGAVYSHASAVAELAPSLLMTDSATSAELYSSGSALCLRDGKPLPLPDGMPADYAVRDGMEYRVLRSEGRTLLYNDASLILLDEACAFVCEYNFAFG